MKPRIGITSSPTVHDERRVDRVSRGYVDGVVRGGGLPVILPTLAPDDAEETLAGLDGLVLTGGGDVAPWLYGEEPAPEVYDVDPARDRWELALIAAAGVGAQAQFPVLAVCRGAQLLNVAAGGSLVQHLPRAASELHRQRDRYGEPVHIVDIEPGSRLATIVGQHHLGVNSVHHQAVDRLGTGLRPVAWTADGVIEAIERTDAGPLVAVQWHPESLIDLAYHGRLFLWLVRSAAERRPGLHRPDAFGPPDSVGAGLGQLVDDVA